VRLAPAGPARGAVLLLLGTLLAGPALAQEYRGAAGEAPAPLLVDLERAPRPVARAVRARGPVVVDGRLDEEAWKDAEPIDGFVQAQPRPGHPASERTTVRILYDERFLYIGALLEDSEPSRLVINTLERDSNTQDTDAFGVALDPFLDRQNSFSFIVNPKGAVRDGQTSNDARSSNFAWNAILHVQTDIHETGWTVEMAIPWTTLRLDPGRPEQVWGLNFLRRIRRKNEESYWAPLERRRVLYTMSSAGTLEGLEGVRQGRNLTLKPYMLGTRSTGSLVPAADHGAGYDGGLDLKWGVTSGLTLDLTYRTDFSQVEVDQEQVNLTRFSLFFPEKRDFFLENSGTFDFGDVSERNVRVGASLRDLTLFHSRRIGLTPDGRPIPLAGGARMTGRAGPYEIGLLEMQTEAMGDLPAENFAVARVRRNVAGRADVGAMLVNRMTTGALETSRNLSLGADANVRVMRYLMVHSYLAATDEAGGGASGGDNLAARLSYSFRSPGWESTGFLKHVGEDFNPAVGFVRRRGMRHGYGTLGLHQRPASLSWVQDLNPYVEADHVTEPDVGLATRTGTLGLDVEFADGGALNLGASDRFERLSRPFRVRADATVPVGDYEFREATLGYRSSRGRPLSGDVALTSGGFFDGERTSLSLATRWRPTYRWLLNVSASHNRVALPDARFTADVVGTRVSYAHSTRLYSSAFVQYNQALDQLVTNLRLNFIHAPLSDLFLVLTERRDLARDEVVERVLSLKMTRLLGF
jgi:hypothetical protein